MSPEHGLRRRRIRFPAAAKLHDTGPLLLHDANGNTRMVRSGSAPSTGDAVRIDMLYPGVPSDGLTARNWTGRWPLSRSRLAVCADMGLAGFRTVALLLPSLLLMAPGALVQAGLVFGGTCLFSASCLARQRLERDETIRIHGRFWDRIIQNPLPAADPENPADDAVQRAFLLERALAGALTFSAERRNLPAPAATIAIAVILIWPDSLLLFLVSAGLAIALSTLFLLESRRLAAGGRCDIRRHDAARLERQLARFMPALRQAGVARQKLLELAERHREIAEAGYALRMLRAAAGAAPVWLAATGVAAALAIRPSLDIRALTGLCLLAPALWCAADIGRRLARLNDARHRMDALRPLGLLGPSPSSRDQKVGSLESVQLENIDFHHDPAEPVLTGFPMAISRGEVIALTGASGSGKSTLLDILMGLKTPQAGQIVVNGARQDWQALSFYRARIAGILQDTPVGIATIRGFVGESAPKAREADILQAIADAGLAKAVAALPMGMQSLIVEGGFPQSLGQQLLIARALAQRPDLLLLDETFSSLDRTVAETIVAAVRRRGITLVFATHRSDLTAMADRTVALVPHSASDTQHTGSAP